MIRKKKLLKGGILLSAILLLSGEPGSTVSWAASLPAAGQPTAEQPANPAETDRPGNRADTDQQAENEADTSGQPDNTASQPDNTSGQPDNTASQPDNTSGQQHNTSGQPDNTADTFHQPEPPLGDTGSVSSGNGMAFQPARTASVQARSSIIWSGELGNTATITGGAAKWWKDEIAPANFTESWIPGVPAEGKFQLSVESLDGEDVVHCQSQDAKGRYAMSNSKLSGIDYTKNYVLSAYVKTENVTGTGFYMRAQVGASVNKNMGDGYKVNGSTDGWQLYQIPLENLASEAGDNSGRMKIEVFFQFFTGDIWVKDITLTQLDKFSMKNKVEKINMGETITLQLDTDIPAVSMGDVVWTSADDTVATVSGGDVTGIRGGNTTITASLDPGLSTDCRVYVNDPEMAAAYGLMRDKWTERLTGNSYWKGNDTSEEYKAIVKGYDEAADKALAVFSDNPAEKLFTDLDLVLKEGSRSTNSNDSVDLSTAVSRILDMARAWACTGSKYYQNDAMRERILYGFDWIHTNIYHENLDNKARYGNWYHWWISMPQNLAGAAILMYGELGKPENMDLLEGINATLANFNEDPGYVYKVLGAAGKMDMTGANLADTSLVSVLRSALAQDQEGVVLASSYFDDMVKVVTSGEGIYADGSFIQHTNLAYTGGYGATLLNGTEKIIYLTTGSRWEIPGEQLNVIFNWIWNGIRPLYADGAVFEMVSGRSVARPGRSDLTTGRGILAGVVLMAKSAPEEMQGKIRGFAKKHLLAGAKALGEGYYSAMNAAAMMEALSIVEDEAIVPGDGTPYARVFGGMDKAVAHSEGFSAGFSLSSGRTGRFEYGNQENSRGWHQGDGMLYLYNGDPAQYSDHYWDTIDSQRLPGITTDHSTWTLKDWGNYPGNANYNGGAALDRYAAIAMNFKNYSAAANNKLTAKKVWFVFDDEILCMGAGITGINKTMDTETIVENKKVNGGNKLLLNGEPYSSQADVSGNVQQVKWAWLESNTGLDAMGYYFPSESDVFVKRETRTGSYRDINNGNTAVDGTQASRNYVSLSLKHGELADGKTESFKYEDYDYVLLPGKTSDEVKAYAGNPDIEILANNAYVQAAHDKNADVYSYVFWQPSASSNKSLRVGDVESDYATVIMQRNTQEKTITLGIADPLQNRDKVTVRLYGNHLKLVSSDSNVTVAKTDKYGVVLDVATRGTKGATFQAVFTYEEQSGDMLAQYENIRKTHADNLTGNSFKDRTDAEYRTIMDNYTQNAREVWDSLLKDADRTKLWDDLNITLDYIGKGIGNNDSVPFDTTTDRIRTMALAYASEGSSLYQNEALGRDIKEALSFVLDHYPTQLADKVYGNWWHWDIGIAQDLCDITLLLYDELDQNTIDRVYYHLDTTVPFAQYCWMRGSRPYLYTTSAANTMDIGVVRALTGAIGNDSKALYMASDALPTLMKYVTRGDGFYEDGSYVQHGTLAYTGGYGADAIRGVAKIAALTNGTPWECTEADPNIVYEWILNGFRPLYADGGVFEMVTGRQISRYNRNDITTGRYIMDAILTLAEDAPDKYRDKILSFAKTQVAAGVAFDKDAYYGRLRFSSLMEAKKLLADDSIPVDQEIYTKIYGQMDKAVIHGGRYALGISMYSSRTGNAECGNSENYKGWYTSDGMTYLYNGDQKQYNDSYWPTVDMTRLAGITTNHVTGNLGNFSDHLSPNDWVGGSLVKDVYASIGMDFTAQFPVGGANNLTAKKSWFALGDQIVALGAGITSSDGDFTETIVDNRKIDNGNVLLADGREVAAKAGDRTEEEIKWAWLSPNKEGEGIGYYFPEGSRVVMERNDRTGKWQDINTSANMINEETAKDITRRYVTLSVHHGAKPVDESYSYVLLPGRTSEDMAAYAEKNGIEVLSNTAVLQAVRDTVTGAAGYNFWEAGEFKPEEGSDAFAVKADRPVSLTMAEETGVITFGVADPTQKADSVSITVAFDTANLAVVSHDENVTVDVAETGNVTLTVETRGKHGASFSAVLADKAILDKLQALDNAEKALSAELTTSDLEQVLAVYEELKALDVSGLGETGQQRARELSKRAEQLIRDMEIVNKAVGALEAFTSVNQENEEAAAASLKAVDQLSGAQKAFMTDAQKQIIAAVRKLLQAYLDDKNNGDDDNGGSDNGDDESPEDKTELEKAENAVSDVLKKLEQSLEEIKNSQHPESAVAELLKQLSSNINWKKAVEGMKGEAAALEAGRRTMTQLGRIESLLKEVFNTEVIVKKQDNVPDGFAFYNVLLSVSCGRDAIVSVEKAQKESSFTLTNGKTFINASAYQFSLIDEDGGRQPLQVPTVIRIPVHSGLDLTSGNLTVIHYYGEGPYDYEELPILSVGRDYIETVTSGFSTFVVANIEKASDNNGGEEDNSGKDNPAVQGNASDRRSPKTYDDSPFKTGKKADTRGNNSVLAAQNPAGNGNWGIPAALAAVIVLGLCVGLYLKKRGR